MKKPTMTNLHCGCGNKLLVPNLLIELGLVTECGHCDYEEFPKENHEAVILQVYLESTEEELREMAQV